MTQASPAAPTQSESIDQLTGAVCALMAAFRGVEKNGVNAFHRYNYASDADILWTIKPLLAEHGLSFTLVSFTILGMSEVKTKREGTERLIDLSVTYQLAHTSGQWRTITAPGSGQDPGDKAHYKAMTGALKYALRQTFAIPTGDDPERDEDDDRGRGRRPDDRPEPARQDPPRQERQERPAEPRRVDASRTGGQTVDFGAIADRFAALTPPWTKEDVAAALGIRDFFHAEVSALRGLYAAAQAGAAQPGGKATTPNQGGQAARREAP